MRPTPFFFLLSLNPSSYYSENILQLLCTEKNQILLKVNIKKVISGSWVQVTAPARYGSHARSLGYLRR